MKSSIYKSDLIQSGINDMWFVNHIDKGIVYAEYFDPLPVKMMALVLTVVSIFEPSDICCSCSILTDRMLY
jgi:hypothetical protein